MNKNIVCICGTFINSEIQFCETCGLGLPEIKLKEPKQKVPKISFDTLRKLRTTKHFIIKLSESF